MIYSLTLLEDTFEQLRATVFSAPEREGAAYLLCRESRTASEVRLLGREVIPVVSEHYLTRRPDFLSISSTSYVSVAKLAKREQLSIVFVHSHPGGLLAFSQQDDREETNLQQFLHDRLPDRLHGSLVLTERGIIGRVYDQHFQPLSRIRVIGKWFTFHDRDNTSPLNLSPFDRQIRAFGPDIQGLLHRLHVGVVGAGGTGSAVIEQLARLGIGTLSIFDGDVLNISNVNRVYGSMFEDSGQPKVLVARRNVERIGLGTKVCAYADPITRETVARQLRGCDVVFGCTDKETPRGILVQLSLRYLIPVLDMGIVIASTGSTITDVVGRITTVLPGEACLFCRKRITPEGMRLESLSPCERDALAREGYAPELETPSPAVIPFTSSIASLAVSEFLHRLTGYMGNQRHSSEVLCFFDRSHLRRNRLRPGEHCICAQRSLWGRGDSTPYLDTWWDPRAA